MHWILLRYWLLLSTFSGISSLVSSCDTEHVEDRRIGAFDADGRNTNSKNDKNSNVIGNKETITDSSSIDSNIKNTDNEQLQKKDEDTKTSVTTDKKTDSDSVSESYFRFRSISTGAHTQCGIVEDSGKLLCWGGFSYRSKGNLGNGSWEASLEPVAVLGLSSGTIDVAVGNESACALNSKNQVLCWGENNFGELGNQYGNGSNTPVVIIDSEIGITEIENDSDTYCATNKNGNIFCWGERPYPSKHGYKTHPIPAIVSGLKSKVSKIVLADNEDVACALTVSSTLYCWGEKYQDDLQIPIDKAIGTSIAMFEGQVEDFGVDSAYGICILTKTKKVYCSGKHFTSGGSGKLSDFVEFSTIPDGTERISVGSAHACALNFKKEVYCWGSNGNGQLGIGNLNDSTVPKLVPLSSSAIDIVLDGDRTCAITESNDLFCWGSNIFYSLIEGQKTEYLIPTRINGINGKIDKFDMRSSFYVKDSNSKVYTWGIRNPGSKENVYIVRPFPILK